MRQALFIILLIPILILSGCTARLESPTAPASARPVEKAQSQEMKPMIVKLPWHKNEFQKGVQLYLHPSADQTHPDHQQELIERNLNYIVSLGANAIGISFPIYTDGATPTRVYRGTDTPSTHLLRFVILEAQKRKLRIMLRPIIDEKNIVAENRLAWRGSIIPKRSDQWFQSYQSLILDYAALAKHLSVDELVLGTELTSLQDQRHKWQTLIDTVKHSGYQGTVSYAVNWNNWSSMPFKTMGIDAYPAINLGDKATRPQLTKAISHWFSQWPVSIRKKLTVQEAGILAQSGMYPHPWQTAEKLPINESIQANWFAAMYDAAKIQQTNGIYYWMLDASHDPFQKNEHRPAGSFVGREAEKTIKRNFTSE
ncbi:MAG: hypothetical protein ABF629_04675 [Sporolactobacillus sp.]